ncbi:Ubiquitin thioesterase [Aphelenchoides bicaudatus]|nr:Ubiquitin thioesterase [Aphelenchoides bicaudatus]
MSAEQVDQNAINPESSENPAELPDPSKTLAEQINQNEVEMYKRTQEYMQEIEEEVRQTQALVGKKDNIDLFVAEYDPEISPKYHAKAKELAQIYSHLRKIRGDGNCFYRAVLTAELERCVENKDELERFTALCKKWKDTLLQQLGFPELTTGDFCEAIEALLEAIKDGTKNLDFLLDDLNNDSIANYYVAFTRLITSGFLRENAALYECFIEGGQTLDQFCREEVEPMWKDCDHLTIIGLVNAIDVPVRIEYVDQSQAPNGGWHHDFPEDREPQLFFLYRPGHYDILYKK